MKQITSSLIVLLTVAACGGSGGGGPATTAAAGGQAPIQAPGNQPPPSSTPPTQTPPTTVNNLSFTGLLNDVRTRNGAGTVGFDARLASAAQGHADDMLANDYFSHTGRNGSSPGDRIRAAGYQWRTYGENIAQGQQSEAQVMTAWTNSPGHHANNVNPNFEDYGLGVAGTGGDKRWVLVLGAE